MSDKNEFTFPTTGIKVKDKALLLSIDDASLPLRRALCYYFTKPKVRPEPVLVGDRDNPIAPDNACVHFYGTVLKEGNKFRMWYYACHFGRNPDWPPEMQAQQPDQPGNLWVGPICYAEGQDGIHWTKPNLGQVLFKGSTANNAIKLPHIFVAEAHVIRDDEDPNPARRYKLAYWAQGGFGYPNYPVFVTAVSPDGITWTVNNIRPTDMFFEGGSFYKHNGYYIVNGQSFCEFLRSEGDAYTGRWGIAMLSRDFDKWLQEWGVSFALPEPQKREDRKPGNPYDQVHLGTGAASFGNVLVGHYAIWHDKPNFADISADFGLVVSNDGITFREPEKGYVWLSTEESAATPVPGMKHNTNLCQGNGILNVGNETWIYHGRWRNTGGDPDAIKHYGGDVGLATIPRDRWAGLGLYKRATGIDHNNGSVWTCPVTLPSGGWKLTLNADGVAGLSVEVADEHFNLMPQFSGDNSAVPSDTKAAMVSRAVPRAGSDRGRPDEGPSGPPHDSLSGGLDVPVKWTKGNPAELNGKTIRFRIRFKRSPGVEPMLYAVNLEA